MKQIIRVFLFTALSLTLANCIEGGSSQPSTSQSKTQGDYIPNNESDLGQIARFLVNNDVQFQDFYFSVNAGNGAKTYGDSQILFAIRGYMSAKTKTIDVQGEMDVLLENPYDAFIEATYIADGSSRGVSARGLCYLTADVMESFGIQTSLVLLDGVSHPHAPDGQYCIVEAHLPNGDMMIDPYLNRSWQHSDHGSWLSTSEMFQVIESETMKGLMPSPDGMANAMLGWSPLNGFYHAYESIANSSADQERLAKEVLEATFDQYQVIPYGELRN